MSIEREFQVLIVGGGLAGLATAAFLRAAGLDPVVVERDDDHGIDGPVTLPSDATTILDWLGVGDDVRDAGTGLHVWECRGGNGSVDRRQQVPATTGLVAIEYSTLRRLLEAQLPEEALRTGTTVVDVAATDRTVTVSFDSGVTEQFDAVVGADGRRSVVRSALDGGQPRPLHTISCAFELSPADGSDDRLVEQWRADGTVLRVLPAGDDRWGWLTVPVDDVTDCPNGETVANALAETDWLPDEPLEAPQEHGGPPDSSDLAVTEDVRVRAETIADDRIALVGDAAHASHRLTGLGPTLALEDAAALTCALVRNRASLSGCLARYAAHRRPRLDILDAPASDPELETTCPIGTVPPEQLDTLAPVARVRADRLSETFGETGPTPAVVDPLG